MTAQLRTARFAPAHGTLLAVDPRALGLEFLTGGPAAAVGPFERVGDVAVVRVDGPLVYAGWLFDSYAGVRGRVQAALSDPDVRAVILKLNTPGGEVSGAFDCARGMRADAAAAGKPLWAFTEAQCCSAGYALATAATEFSASDSAEIGSIGVVGALCSEAAADAAKGVTYAVITSGARKADGNPHVPLTDDTIAAAQAKVDDMARVFFALCEAHRPGLKPEGLQAGVFVGASAQARRLVDRIETWDACLARLGATLSGTASATRADASKEDPPMPDDDKEKAAKAAADEAAKAKAAADDSDGGCHGSDEPKKDATRAALVKALGAATDPAEKARLIRTISAYDKEDGAHHDHGKEEASASAASGAAGAAAPAASLGGVAAAALQAQEARIAALESERVKAETETFFASRPDLPETMIAELRKLPLEQAKILAAAIPVTREGTSNPLVAQVGRSPAQGATAVPTGLAMRAEDKARLDAAMGLTGGAKLGAVFDPNSGRHAFGVPVKA